MIECPECSSKWTIPFKESFGYQHILLACRSCEAVFVKNKDTDGAIAVNKEKVESLIDSQKWPEFEDYITGIIKEAKKEPISYYDVDDLKYLLETCTSVDDFLSKLP